MLEEDQCFCLLEELHLQATPVSLRSTLAQESGKEGCDILAVCKSQKSDKMYLKRALVNSNVVGVWP